MSQVCRQCSRINPADGSYCYYDGVALGGHSGSGPINAGSAPFPNQFVFPTGQTCRNFDQLALACQQNWTSAIDMLKQGFLGTFFGGLGRTDLAIAAMEASRFPDADRGLDQLLTKLPTSVLSNPQLLAEPTDVNLGIIPMGSDRNTELHLHNQGMRLLYGEVVSDSKWLTLGDAPGASQKHFQFGSETIIPVHVRGQHLRAGNKPLEGRLVVESNGGSSTILFRVDVPVKPFPGGPFDGAKTPRQIAEKAKANPKEAAPYFENGAVAQWFASNGWTYPVQGPNASGLGGVQQFFEALGLAKAPKVTVSTQSLSFRGDGGQSLQATIEVSSQEKKPVYAYATCDQPWVDCSRVKLEGRTAIITVAIPRVPNRPGETLQTKIKVMGNGNQRFSVPLLLTVDRADPNPPPEVYAPAAPQADASMFAPQAASPYSSFVPAAPAVITPVMAPSALPAWAVNEVPAAAPAAPAPMPLPYRPAPVAVAAGAMPPPHDISYGRRRSIWVHLAPLMLLLIALGGVLGWDGFAKGPVGGQGSDPLDNTERLRIFFDYADKLEKGINNTMSFGLVMIDPSKANTNPKLLTYDPRGRSNSAVALIDGTERLFGNTQIGKWEERPKQHGRGGKSATFIFSPDQIFITQRVEIVPGEAVEVSPEVYRRLLDTCLVRYTIKNRDTKSHKVGFRFLLDTLIGSNDGCPFTIPGSTQLVSTFEDFNPADGKNKKPIPDFVQALEFEELRKPGTIAQVNFKLSDKLEAPGRVMLTAWPGGEYLRKFDIPLANIERDSAVVMVWPPTDLEPGKTRDFGFSYGIGNLTSQSEKIGLTFGGSFVVKGELSVVALIADPQKGQSATIEFPPGSFTALDGYGDKQNVPPSLEKTADGRFRASPVTWRLRSARDGTHTITIRTSDGLEATRKITIKKSSIF